MGIPVLRLQSTAKILLMRAQIPVGWTVYFYCNQYLGLLDGLLQKTYGPLVSSIAGGLGHFCCLSDHDGCRLGLSCGLSEWRGIQLWFVVPRWWW
jgi:hypothetical protein